MAGHNFDNGIERVESQAASNFSSLSPDLLAAGPLSRPNQMDSSTISRSGFPDLDLVQDEAAAVKAERPVSLSSKYDTGAELTSDRELKQAGLDPRNLHHKLERASDGGTQESTSVKYPNGLEVTVSGRTKHMASGRDVVMDPESTIKEPLPKGIHKDSDGDIFDAHNQKIGQINDDGTVTLKVGKGYLTQGPAGVREEAVIEDSNRGGMITRIGSGH